MFEVADELGPNPIAGLSSEPGSGIDGLAGSGCDKEWDWLSHDTGMCETHSSNVESWDIPLTSPPAASFTPPSGTGPGLSIAALTSAAIVSDSMLAQKLLAVATEMERCLRTLELGQWLFDSTEGLDKYPIGSVLHLSQEFSATANLAFKGVNTHQRATVPFCSDNHARVTAAPGRTTVVGTTDTAIEAQLGAIDTTTSLLVLTGHNWLVQIYCAVLGHFQTYLSRGFCPGNSKGLRWQSTAASLGANPFLQLGELAGPNECSEFGKIHMALNMLQRAVHEVEKPLGRGATALRSLVVTRLTKETFLGPPGNLNEEGDRLEKKFQLVKTLLREQMGL